MRVNKLLGTLVVTCVLVDSVRGEAIIDVGSHDLQPNSPGQQVKLSVTGDDQVTGFNLRAQIGDGTESTTPVFEGIDFGGGMWDAGDTTVTGGPVETVEQFAQASVTFNDTMNTTTDELLLTMNIDTTGIFSGQFDLRLKDLVNENGSPIPDSEFILTGGGALAPTIANGTVNVVPEPASVMLLSVGGLFAGLVGFFARRRGKQ
ncbi:MAG: hypothetical protein ACODAD_05440 [Planctomycetota bacterium]